MSRSLWSAFSSLAAVTAIVKPSGGIVLAVYALNNNVADRYFQLFDRATALAGGEVPVLQWKIPLGGGEIIVGTDFFTNDGVGFNVGIVFGISTTKDSYVAATAGDHDAAVVWA
jgi:hypothetical protein